MSTDSSKALITLTNKPLMSLPKEWDQHSIFQKKIPKPSRDTIPDRFLMPPSYRRWGVMSLATDLLGLQMLMVHHLCQQVVHSSPSPTAVGIIMQTTVVLKRWLVSTQWGTKSNISYPLSFRIFTNEDFPTMPSFSSSAKWVARRNSTVTEVEDTMEI